MTRVPTTASTKDWLGSGTIMPFPIPTGTQTLSSRPSEEDDEPSPDAEKTLRESSKEEHRKESAPSDRLAGHERFDIKPPERHPGA